MGFLPAPHDIPLPSSGVAVSSLRDDVKSRIDAIEASYEFFLAFAAQGLTSDQGSKSGGQLRMFLGKCEGADLSHDRPSRLYLWRKSLSGFHHTAPCI